MQLEKKVIDRLDNPPIIKNKKPIDLGDMPEDMDLALAKVTIFEIVEEVSEVLASVKKKDTGTTEHPYDKSGQSTTTDVYFNFKSGFISVSCYDWSTKMGFADHLRIRILTEEFNKFLNTAF